MEKALKLIIARSPDGAYEAMRTLLAIRVSSPMIQQRYHRTIEIALGDPQAQFTADERALLAEHLEIVPDGTRDFTLRIRLTAAEHEELIATADDEHTTVSEFVRRQLFED